MLANFFGSGIKSEWKLNPSKFPKDSENNYSSKVLLPYRILGELVSYGHQTPYIFEILHENGIYKTACSVLDFELENEEIVLPSWMYEQLCLEKGDKIILRSVEAEQGEGICLLPHSVDFLELEDPKKELEKTFTNYHVLSYGDEVLLYFADIGRCRFTVTKIEPDWLNTIYIVDTDLKVEFEEPLGYKEKIESEKTIMKYVRVEEAGENIKILTLKKPGLFVGWEDFGAKCD